MQSFASVFPEIGPNETRCVIVLPVDAAQLGLPAGKYAFLEFYCPDLSCDCRRVIVRVVEESDPETQHASINFGWESEEFYTQWMRGNRQHAREIRGASIDPLNPSTDRAEALLEVFRTLLMTDAVYVKRLETHYWMFKRAIRQALMPSFGKKKRKLLKG